MIPQAEFCSVLLSWNWVVVPLFGNVYWFGSKVFVLPLFLVLFLQWVQNIETVGFNYEPALERRGSVEVRLTFEVVLQEIQGGTFPLLTNYLSAQNLFQKSSGTESPPLWSWKKGQGLKMVFLDQDGVPRDQKQLNMRERTIKRLKRAKKIVVLMRKSGGMEGYPEPLCAFFCRMQAADFGVTLTPVREKIHQIIFEGQLHNWQIDILKVTKAFFPFALVP